MNNRYNKFRVVLLLYVTCANLCFVGEDLGGGYRVSTGRDSLLFSPPEEERGEEEQQLGQLDLQVEQETSETRLSGMSQAARAVMGLEEEGAYLHDEDRGRPEHYEPEELVAAASDTALAQARAKPRAPKRKSRPRELQEIPDAPLELTAKEIKASLADTSNILRRNPSDPLPILRRPRPAHGRGVTSRMNSDFIGADTDTERPDEVVCIGGRHDAFFSSRFGRAAVPTVTQLGLPSVRGLCPELQEVFHMTLSSEKFLPFPPSKKRREEMKSAPERREKVSGAAAEAIPEVEEEKEEEKEEEEVELARDRTSTSALSTTGRPSLIGEGQQRVGEEGEKFDHGEVSGMSTEMEGFAMEESMELPSGKSSFAGHRMSEMSFSSGGVLGGFEEDLLPEQEGEEDLGRRGKTRAAEEEEEEEEEEGRGSRFQPVGVEGRGELSAAAAKEGRWNSRTSTVYKALNKRLEDKVWHHLVLSVYYLLRAE